MRGLLILVSILVSGTLMAQTTPPKAAPTPSTPAAAAPKPAAPKPAPRRRKSSNLPSIGDMAGVVGAKGWRRILVGLLLVALVGAGFIVYPLIFPSALKARGEKVAQAWLSKNAEQIQRLAEPEQSSAVERWLDKHPPPSPDSLQGAPTVNVAVEREDGKTAEVVVQVTAKKKDGQPTFYVFHHHWIQKGGYWYFRPPQ